MSDITWDDVRENINRAAMADGEWAGAPLPVEGLRLVVNPKYTYQKLNGVKLDDDEPVEPVADDFKLRNQWRSKRLGGTVYIMEEQDGRITHSVLPDGAGRRLMFAIHTLGASRALRANAEIVAMGKLASHISDHAFNCYVLTGTFLETSKRSRVTYLFRKCRPTLALRPNRFGTMRAIAALCLHPIGFYEDSWMGCMAPSDDVIAHLLLMRGNEWMFWKQANHHSIDTPEAGV